MSLTLEQLVARDLIDYYDSVAINIDDTHNYYITMAPRNLTLDDGKTYIAAGGLLKMSDFVDSATFSIEQLSISVAGIVELESGESVIKLIQELDYIDKPVTIYRVFMDQYKPAHEIMLFKGYISGIGATYNSEGETTQATFTVASHWTDFDRTSSRYTNSKSQQEYFPDDLGFDYAVDVQKEVTWREDG